MSSHTFQRIAVERCPLDIQVTIVLNRAAVTVDLQETLRNQPNDCCLPLTGGMIRVIGLSPENPAIPSCTCSSAECNSVLAASSLVISKVLGCIESRAVSEVREGLCMRSYGEVGIHSGLKLSVGAAAWASPAFL